MVKFLQKFSKPAHTIGVTVAVPHTRFSPTPTMHPGDVAYSKGVEAKRLGRPASDNPYTDKLAPNNGQLSAEWNRGYGS